MAVTLFGWSLVRGRGSRAPKLDDADSAEDIRSAILGYLRTHRDWYHSWSSRYSVGWNLLTFLILVLGALTSILTAIGGVSQWILVTLPAISSLCAALLIQFKLRDGCRIREGGRIAVELLICKALALPLDDPAKARREAIALREEAHRIELDQVAQFMLDQTGLRPRGPDATPPDTGQPPPGVTGPGSAPTIAQLSSV